MDSISCQWAIIFISFEVNRENTDWLTRPEKARVSQLHLNYKQFLCCVVGIINNYFSLLQGRPVAPTLYILIRYYYYYFAVVDLIIIAIFKWQWASIFSFFFSFQVKQEDTVWMTRLEKAGVS